MVGVCRYRISPRLFKRIADAVTAYDDFFKQKRNSAGKKGCHPYQKCLAAIKMLATGCSADSLDREFRMSAALIMKSLTLFIRAVVHLFKDEYLRHPTAQEIQELLQEAEKRGFPGMIGSIDCMHWVWDKCPVAWHGEHKGHFHKPTIILEAVASYNLRFWHCFFGLPGSLNDINVLNRSPVFDDLASGNAPQYNFNVNGHSYDMGYYLADGIYPDWATLVKGVAAPVTEKQQLFTMKQSAYRKDVERAFGVLQAKFAVVRGPAKMHHVKNLDYTMRCCVIIHNMAVEDEHGLPRPRIEDFENGRKLPLLPKNVPRIEELIANHKKIENKEVHYRLQNDLMEHVWSRFGHTRGNLMTVLCLSHDAWFVHDICHTFDSVLFQLLLHMPRKLKGSPQVDEDGRRE